MQTKNLKMRNWLCVLMFGQAVASLNQVLTPRLLWTLLGMRLGSLIGGIGNSMNHLPEKSNVPSQIVLDRCASVNLVFFL